MKHALRFCVFTVVCFAAVQAAAQNPRWVETQSWKQHGTMITPLFWVNTSEWRLACNIKGRRTLRVTVYDAESEVIDTMRPLRGPDAEQMRVRKTEPGYYYLEIQAVDADWEVAVHQFVSTIQEWQLLEHRKTPPRPLLRVAEYTGESGSDTFTINISQPHWKLLWTFTEPGVFEFIVEHPEAEDKPPVYRALLTKPGRYGTWIHQAGTFTLRVKAAETGRWEISAAVPEER